MAFGGPRSSCVRPGAHSARRQDSCKDLTPCRMALHFVSAGARAPHSDETPALRLRGGRRTPLVAYAPSLSYAPPWLTLAGPPPVTMASCVHPVVATLAKQLRPPETTWVAARRWFLRSGGELSLAKALELTQAHGDGVAVAVSLNGRDKGGLAGSTAPTLPPWTFATQASIVHLYVSGQRLAVIALFHRLHPLVFQTPRGVDRRPPTAASAPGPRSYSSAVSGCISPGTRLSVVASCTRTAFR